MAIKHISAGESESFCAKVMEKSGLTPDDAALWGKLMTETSLLGFDTHGIRQVERYADFLIGGGGSNKKPEIVKENGASVLINANACMGHISAWKAAEIAVENAKKYGIAITNVINGNHVGACALYTKALAEKNCIGICCTVARPGIAPWGGIKPTVGINPLSICAPIEDGSFFLLDMTTSVTAMGKVITAMDNDQKIPLGWALDKNGKPTTEPKEAWVGSLLPIGGYKGYGLALAIEILCSALSGGSFSEDILGWIKQTKEATNTPFMIIAIDIEQFQHPDVFKSRVKEWLATVIDVPKQEGVDRIYFPGEIECENYKTRSKTGIPLEDVTVESFKRVAQKFSLSEPQYFER